MKYAKEKTMITTKIDQLLFPSHIPHVLEPTKHNSCKANTHASIDFVNTSAQPLKLNENTSSQIFYSIYILYKRHNI